MKAIFLPFTLLACASLASAQANLLVNGNFQASRISIAPWTFNGFAENIAIEDFATNGSVVSQAYGATLLSGTPHSIQQPVRLSKGKPYILRVDVHATVVTEWGFVDFQASARSGSTWKPLTKHAQVSDGNTKILMQYGERFVPDDDADAIRLEFRLSTLANPRKVRFNLDEIELFEDSSTSLVYSKSTRYFPRWASGSVPLELQLVGQPGIAHVIYLASARFSAGVTVPGFENQLFLNPTGLFLPMTVLVTTIDGNATPVTLTFPNEAIKSVVGVPLYYQPIAVNPLLNVLQFGRPTNLSYSN